MRDVLIRANSLLLDFEVHTTPLSKLIVGRESRGAQPLTLYDLELWRRMFQDLHEKFAAQYLRFIMAIVTGEEAIFPALRPGATRSHECEVRSAPR